MLFSLCCCSQALRGKKLLHSLHSSVLRLVPKSGQSQPDCLKNGSFKKKKKKKEKAKSINSFCCIAGRVKIKKSSDTRMERSPNVYEKFK